MIDFVQAVLEFRHTGQICAGFKGQWDTDGTIEWTTDIGMNVEGSHDSRIMIRSQNKCDEDTFKEVYISGNPAKFLQGHNLFGSDDLLSLMAYALRRALDAIGKPVDEFTYRRWLVGAGVEIKMVDITYMWHVGSRDKARTWLRALSHTGHMKHRGRGEFRGETLYYGRKSRRWAMKMYCKGDELDSKKKGHRLPGSFFIDPYKLDGKRLQLYADDCVRFELRLLSLELKRLHLDEGTWWQTVDALQLFRAHLQGLQMSEQKLRYEALELELPDHLSKTYRMWRKGYDLRTMLNKATYYRHRKDLLEHGVDIGVTAAGDASAPESRVVPILRPLEAVPARVPDWAEGRSIYFDASKAKSGV
ncbi:MAG: hypothetical protein EVA65_16540 [Oceanococcus sp.]|nr:MAG: hypothetical protein EVA65_16540 [Oceanococcus sp.]